MSAISIPAPELQIDFSFALGRIRTTHLQDALNKTLDDIDLAIRDDQLFRYVPQDSLATLAKRGLRGELVFPVPCVLETNPSLLGYYRLLLGFSQKEFYTTKFGISGFKSMEVKGTLTDKNKDRLPELCECLVGSACALLDGIGFDRISKELLDDLTLLTVGPQLRGGVNVKKGIAGIIDVFAAIHAIVGHAATESTESEIRIINAAERTVFIAFAPDPDIVIREEISAGSIRNIGHLEK